MYDFDFTYDIHPNSIFHYLCRHFVLLMSHVWYSGVLILFCLFVVLFLVSIPVCLFGFHQGSWLFYLNVHDHQGKFKIHMIIYLFSHIHALLFSFCALQIPWRITLCIRCPKVLIGTGELLQLYCSNLAKGLHHPQITILSQGSGLFYM